MVQMSTTYEVVARRAGAWWALEVPSVPGVFTQVKRLDQAGAVAAEAIALMRKMPVSKVRTRVVVKLPDDLERKADDVKRLQEAAHVAAVTAAAESRALVSAMRKAGLSTRDVGQVLGVSHQRVAQLAQGGTKRANEG
jgi:hypothetical protein